MLAPDPALQQRGQSPHSDRMDMSAYLSHDCVPNGWITSAWSATAERPPCRLARLDRPAAGIDDGGGAMEMETQAPIVDLARESAQLESLREARRTAGLEPLRRSTHSLARRSMQPKSLQRSCSHAGGAREPGQFAGVTRPGHWNCGPQIDRVTAEMLTARWRQWDGRCVPSSRKPRRLYHVNPSASARSTSCIATAGPGVRDR